MSLLTRNIHFFLFFLTMMLVSPLLSARTISDIQIKGNKKIEKDAVLVKISSKPGTELSQDKIYEDVHALFDLGFFLNIVVHEKKGPKGLVLVYEVIEKPSMTKINFIGNEELDDDELFEASELKLYDFLNYSQIKSAIERIEALYEDKGFFLAKVTTEVVEDKAKGHGVTLNFNIVENEMVKVKKVQFIGNHALSTDKLKSSMLTQEGGFFSALSSSGAYKQDKFDEDIKRLTFMYYNEGYIQAKIDRPQVYVTPDKKSIYISIRIEEGEKFYVGNIDFSGDLLFSEDELQKTIGLTPNALFVWLDLQKDIQALQAKYGDLGYAYANPIPRTRILEKERLVDITFEIDKGHKVYFGEINVVGNTKTRDKVVRRELKVFEGELYNETRKRESLASIQRLGFFETVNFNSKTPTGRPEIMNVDIVVKEKNTGTIQLGAGYSTHQGLVINGQVSQPNLLGRGQNLGVTVNLDKNREEFDVHFTEPYFADTKWSVGVNGFNISDRRGDYEQKNEGGSLTLGHPLAPYLFGFIGYKYEDVDLKEQDGVEIDKAIYPLETASGSKGSLTLTLRYDKRDNRLQASDGTYGNISVEYVGVGGNKKYTKSLANYRYYKNIFWDVIWRNNLTYGVLSSNDPNEDLPFNERFLLGGTNTLRGYPYLSVGRRKYSDVAYNRTLSDKLAMVPFGGTQQFVYNMEFQFPLVDEAGIKGVVFYDIGNADNSLILEEFKSDVGFGFRWYSPIGPLRFEWGLPLDADKDYHSDQLQFQFSIGSPF